MSSRSSVNVINTWSTPSVHLTSSPRTRFIRLFRHGSRHLLSWAMRIFERNLEPFREFLVGNVGRDVIAGVRLTV